MSDMRQGLRAWAEVEGERIARDDRGRRRDGARRDRPTQASACGGHPRVGRGRDWRGGGHRSDARSRPGPARLELARHVRRGHRARSGQGARRCLQCGKPWVLDRGAVRLATAKSAAASGEWSVAFDDGSTTGDTATIEAGFASLGWTARLQARGGSESDGALDWSWPSAMGRSWGSLP